ncbi:MAG: hypothetical protein M3124_09650 [Actinomycetota bacterium]|nr:hypothetical protein [Actinomycetota bacterium]
MRSIWARTFLAAALIPAGACAGEKSDAPSPPRPRLTTPASPSPRGFGNGGPCPRAEDPSLPPRAGCVTTAVMGDETLVVYARLDREDEPRSWHLRLTGGPAIDQPLDAGNPYSYPYAVGSTDVDADGRPEWWVKVMDFTSHGAPWSSLNLFVERHGSLAAVSSKGEPLGVNVGGIARLGEGARCEDGRLVLLRAEARNPRNTRWTTSERSFTLRGSNAILIGRSNGMLVIDDYNDPDLDPYYRITCEELRFGT